jgi:hypothetical protein
MKRQAKFDFELYHFLYARLETVRIM